MRNENERYAKALLHFFKLYLHALAQLQIKRAERFVKQKHLRAVHERPRYGNALLLPARKLIYPALAVALQVNKLQHFVHAGVNLMRAQLLYLQAERNVIIYVKVRKQRVFLKNGVYAALERRHGGNILAVYEYFALRGHGEARYKAQHSGLSAAGRAEQREEFAVPYIKGNVFQRVVLAVGFAYIHKIYKML